MLNKNKKMLLGKSLILLSCAALSFLPAHAQQVTAKCISVVDGDTINVSVAGGPKQKVILYGVDCPEMAQDFGQNARQFTDQCCFRKDVSIDVKGKDPSGRLIATVYLADGTNLNQALVTQGLAWWSDKFAPNDTALKQMHEAAKAAGKGLWSAPNPVPPWIFRNGDKSVQAVIKTK
jgi:endonuclease YncB( thermonuclease family)